MEVTVDTDENDLIALNDHVVKNLPAIRRQFLRVWIGLPLLFLVSGVGVVGLLGDIVSGGILFGFALLVLVCYPPYLKWCRRRNVRRLLRSGHNLAILGEQRIVITPDEIARYGQFGHAAFYWPAVERIEVGAHHAFVFVSAVQAFVIPKRDFAEESEFDAFVETVRKYHCDAIGNGLT